MTEEQSIKESILKMMIKLSHSDGKLSQPEIEFLALLSKNFNVSTERFQDLLLKYDENFVIPSAEVERMTILYHLLFFVKADGIIHKEEENMIYHFGFKLGFNESLIRDMLAIIKHHLGRYMPPDELLLTIRKYLN